MKAIKAKLKVFFDNKATWAGIGYFASSVFGPRVGEGVAALGALVQVVL